MEKREIIRTAEVRDVKALLEIYRPYVEQTAVTFEYEVPSEKEFSERIRKVRERYPYLVFEREGQSMGYAYASAFHPRPAYDWAVEVSIYVQQHHRGTGIGRKLYEELETRLKEQRFTNLYACIAYPQTEDEYLTKDSVRFHKRMGYEIVGEFHQCGYKFRRWYDMVWMEKMIGVHEEDQPGVTFFSQKNKHSSVDSANCR